MSEEGQDPVEGEPEHVEAEPLERDEDFRAGEFDPNEERTDGRRADGRFENVSGGRRSYRSWLRYLENVPLDELQKRNPPDR